ncbi:MAG: hypothetical protein L6461_01320 [Anaerolineae bacterium]|nr:hypothetical protein [Anaerolineae bacterium]
MLKRKMLTLDWLWFWQKPAITFVTPLPIDECQKRLSSALYFRRNVFRIVSENPVIGEVQDRKFYLTKNPSWLRDDFRPYLYGTLILTPQGTSVQASFRLHAAVTLFISLGMVFLFCFSVGNALLAKEHFSSLINLFFYWIVFLAVFIFFGWLGSWSNKSNRETLVNYLHKTLLPDQE